MFFFAVDPSIMPAYASHTLALRKRRDDESRTNTATCSGRSWADLRIRRLSPDDVYVAERLALAAESTRIRADDPRHLRNFGVFLLIAARNPGEHRSLIAFTAWSSLVHGGVMTMQALRSSMEHGHLLGDVPALFIVGVVLIALAPAKQSTEKASAARA